MCALQVRDVRGDRRRSLPAHRAPHRTSKTPWGWGTSPDHRGAPHRTSTTPWGPVTSHGHRGAGSDAILWATIRHLIAGLIISAPSGPESCLTAREAGCTRLATGGVERSETEPVDSWPFPCPEPPNGGGTIRDRQARLCRPFQGLLGLLGRLIPGAASRFAGCEARATACGIAARGRPGDLARMVCPPPLLAVRPADRAALTPRKQTNYNGPV